MRIALGPSRAARSARRAREWLVTDGLGGYAMGTSRPAHPALPRPARGRADGPARAMLGLAALDPVIVVGERASGSPRTSGQRRRRPAGPRAPRSFDLDDGVPRWRWQVGRHRARARAGDVARRPRGRRRPPARRGGPPCGSRSTALCTWRDAHGERLASADRRGRARRRRLRLRGGVPRRGPGFTPGGDVVPRRPGREEAARGLSTRGHLGRATFPSSSSRRGARGDGGGGAFRRRAAGAAGIVAAARARADALVGGPASPRRRRRAARPRGRPVRDRRPARRPSPATRGSASGRAT